MIDLLQDDILKSTFKNFVRYRGPNSGVFALDDIFMKQPSQAVFNQQVIDIQLKKLEDECNKHSNLFEQNPGQKTILNDIFFGVQKTDKEKKTRHIFYVNPNINDRVVFVEKFLKECIKQKVFFDFEFTTNPTAKNGVTIYATDEQLSEYVDVFDSLEKQYPKLIKRCGDLPVCAQSLGWYAYKSMQNNASLATYLGFSKTLVEYYNICVEKTPTQFIDIFYNICNQRTDKGYCGRVDDDVLYAKFVKNKDKIWQTLNKKNFSIDDINKDKVLHVVRGIRGHNIEITPKYFVEALRQIDLKVDSFTQRRVLQEKLIKNVENGFKYCNAKTSVPSQVALKTEKQKDSQVILNLTKKSAINLS